MGDLKMPEINCCIFAGRVIRDGELRYLANGTACLKFSIAVDRRYKKDAESVKETVFPSIVVWGKHAEYLAPNIKKGVAVLVDRARMAQRKWQDKQGAEQHATEYHADKVYVLEWPSDSERPTKRTPAHNDEAPVTPSYAPPENIGDETAPFDF